MPRTCMFCGARPLTKEHVWPKWAGSVLPACEPVSFEQLIEVDGQPRIMRSRTALPFRETARIVCATCNNGWMAKLEQRAAKLLAPMARGERVVLAQDDQHTLAAWALKTAVVLDHAQGRPWQPSRMQAEYRHLAQFLMPSTNVLVWLASSLVTPPGRARLWGASGSVDMLSGERRSAVVWGATITLGPVCFQVFCTTIPSMPNAYALEERPAISLIWPYRESFDWRTREGFDHRGLDDFASALPALLRSIANESGVVPGSHGVRALRSTSNMR